MNGPVRVLHVDDDQHFAELTVTFLAHQSERFDIVTERTVAEALDRLQTEAFDCIVSDYDMPGQNGLDFLDQVRHHDPEMPFILFTGKGSEEVAADAISKGVTDYLQKSGGSETYAVLANRIENAVETRRTREQVERSQRFLEKVVEHATDVIATVDTEGRIVFVSGSIREVLGYEPDEIRAHGAFGIIHPDDRETVREHFENRLADPDRPTGITFRVEHHDGSIVEMEGRAYNHLDDPDVEGIILYSRTT